MRRTVIIGLILIMLTLCPTLASATVYRQATTYHGYSAAADSCIVEFAARPAMTTIVQRFAKTSHPLRQISLIDGSVILAAQFGRLAGVRGPEVAIGVADLDPARDLGDQLDEVSALPGVAAVWPNYIAHLDMHPNDPYYGYAQSNFPQIYVDKAWDLSTGAGVTVAVIDTGYRKAGMDDRPVHILTGYDFWGNDNNPNDYIGHGTHISNTIAEHTNNGIGCAGIAFDANILPCKVFPDSDQGALESDIIDAIYWATSHGANVINMSLGGPDYDSATESAIANAVSNEVIVFAAAGNDGWSPVEYPAAYADCIAVGATNPHNPGAQPTRADFSDYGSALDLMAPGVQITQETFDPNYGTVDYYTYDGTSCSSPHAAAVAAMLIAKGGANVAAVRDAMQKTARGTNHKWTQTLGWGEIDAFAAVQAYGGAPNQPPQAVAKASPTHGAAPLTVQFDGSASSDPDGSIVSYVWTVTQTGEVIGTSAKFSHTFTKAGTNTVSLAVKDNDGATASDSVTISVSSGGDDDAGPGDDDSSASDDDLGDDACGHMLEKIYNSCDFVIMQNGSAFYSAQTAYDMCRADQPNGDVWACMEGCETHPQVHTCSDYQACVAAKCSVTLAQNPSGDDDSGHDSVGYGCSM